MRTLPEISVLVKGLHRLGGGAERWRAAYAAAGVAEAADAAVADPQLDGTHRWAVADLGLLCEAIVVLHGPDALRAVAAYDKRKSIDEIVTTTIGNNVVGRAGTVDDAKDLWPLGLAPGSLSAGLCAADAKAMKDARSLLSSGVLNLYDKWVTITDSAPITAAMYAEADIMSGVGSALWEFADRGIDVDYSVLGKAGRALTADQWNRLTGRVRDIVVDVAFETGDVALMRTVWNPLTPVCDDELLGAVVAHGPDIALHVFNAAAQRASVLERLCEMIGAGELTLNEAHNQDGAGLLATAARLAPYGKRFDVKALCAAGAATRSHSSAVGTVIGVVAAQNALSTYTATELAAILTSAGPTTGQFWQNVAPSVSAALLEAGGSPNEMLHGLAQCPTGYLSALLDIVGEPTRLKMYMYLPRLAAGISASDRDVDVVRACIRKASQTRSSRPIVGVAANEISAGRPLLAGWLWELLEGGGRELADYGQLRRYMLTRLSSELDSASQWLAVMTMLAESDTLTCAQIVDCVKLIDAAA